MYKATLLSIEETQTETVFIQVRFADDVTGKSYEERLKLSITNFKDVNDVHDMVQTHLDTINGFKSVKEQIEPLIGKELGKGFKVDIIEALEANLILEQGNSKIWKMAFELLQLISEVKKGAYTIDTKNSDELVSSAFLLELGYITAVEEFVYLITDLGTARLLRTESGELNINSN